MLARHIEPRNAEDVRQRAGEVIALEGSRCIVRCDDGSLVADRAVSCLVEPRVRDRVLVASAGEREHYVLAVLRRTGDEGIDLSAPGDLRVKLANGRLDVEVEQGVAITSRAEVAIASKELEVHGAVARFAVERLSVLGAKLEAHLGDLRAVAGGVDAVFERIVSRVKHSQRFVEETDRLDAGEIEMSATGTLSVAAHDAVVTAEQLVKIDGEQVHVG